MSYNCELNQQYPAPRISAGKPPDILAVQQAFIDWAEANPNELDSRAEDGFVTAMMDSFPC